MHLLFNAPSGATEGLQEDIEVALVEAVGASGLTLPTTGALAVEVVLFCARPAEATPADRWPVGKPTVWQVATAVRRALHGIVLKNDSHVVSIKTDKRYCCDGVEPHTRVEIWTAGTLRDGVRLR